VSEQGPEKKRKWLPIVVVGVILAAVCAISLYLRIALSSDSIFVNDWVFFRETDAYYYMRNIETLVHNFPHFNIFDPYQLYPGGSDGLVRPFFAWLVAGIILLVKGAASSLHAMESMAVYITPILGTLTLIPVYFIGKELFNRWVGVISAALVVIIPSEFMHRSLLGFTDHHAAETLFATVCMLFLIMAVKRAREREISFGHILSRDWSTIRKPLIYTLFAGIFLGIYLLTWVGGLLFIFVIFAYLVIQFIVDHLRRKSTDYLCIIGTPVFLVAFLMLLPILGKAGLDPIYRVSMSIAVVVPVLLSVISRVMSGRALKPLYYPLALLGLLGIGLLALQFVNPSLFRYMRGLFGIFTPGGAALTIMEVAPLLFPSGSFSLANAWANFNTPFFIAFVSFGMLIYVAIKEKSADKILFLVWSILMLMAVLGQRRFGYYYTVNLALLTGYFSWKMLDIAGLRKLLGKSRQVVQTVKKFKKKQKKAREEAKPRTFMQPRGAWVRVIVVGIVLFVVVFLPSVPLAKALGSSPNYVMDQGWQTSLLWLEDNSPEPFGDPDFYYALYPPRDEFQYPDTAYGVMSWWDYGHFIMQIAHRVPNANPGQAGAVQAGQFFTAQNETAANEVADKEGTAYVMIDYMTATSKFYAMVEWAGKNVSEFHDVFYVPTQTGGQFTYLFYPAYYQSTVARLYNFDGKNVTVVQPIAISYVERVGSGGEKYKEVTSGQPFSTYEDAQAYVANQTSGNYRIVGADPFTSILPLEGLDSYELVYSSGGQTPVKIFRYLGSSES